jgi:UDP-GlcNAc:undecaprenyl-phosphate/decaprenyl-phosphate GlcNAc-1-phosphate transferase
MNSFVISCLVALIVSAATMPVLVKVSRSFGAISEIGGRHIGKQPIGRLGGVGALLGILVSLSIQNWLDPLFSTAWFQYQRQTTGLILGLILVATVGFWDDIRRLRAFPKLLAQVVAALICYFFGLRISGVDLPLLEPFQLGWLGLPITVLWIVGIVNAVNLIDGLDGLAGGVLLFASVVNFMAAIGSGSIISAALMVSMGGAVIGFLLFNWHPAKIYLGDGGAYSLGFILAVNGLLAPVQKASTGIALLVPILAVGLPVFDTLLTMLRRFMSRRGIFSPDRGHLHHILLDAGISHRRVVLGLYAVCCVLCSAALMMVLNRNRNIGYCLMAASVAWIGLWGFSVKTQLRRVASRIFKSSSEKVSMNSDGY